MRPRLSRQLWFAAAAGLLGLFLLPAAKFASAEQPVNSDAASLTNSILDPIAGVGSWIWGPHTTDQQTCRLWKSFEIPPGVQRLARLRITADNAYMVFLDGREIGKGSEWRSLVEHDLTSLLPPGPHVLAVEAFNDWSAAGVLLGLRVDIGGKIIEVASDGSWYVVPLNERGWKKKTHPSPAWGHARIVAALGTSPWRNRPGVAVRVPAMQPVSWHFWQSLWFQALLMVFLLLAIGISLRLAGKLALRARAEEILKRERARLARDIHDELGAGLTQLVLLGEVHKSELPLEEASHRHFDEVSEKARALLQKMNEVVWTVNSQRDTLRDFAGYISKYAQTYLAGSPIRCRLDLGEGIGPVPFDLAVRRNLFLAVKEALHNALRHSGATELVLRVHLIEDHQLVVEVRDNGKGFDPAREQEGNGLSNMVQRAEEFGGWCRLTSEPCKGCKIEFGIPLAQKRNAWFGRLGRGWWPRSERIEHAAHAPSAPSPAA
ncbi:MAG TPA: ATP-binding protein [Verrucomicrobiae bacterium]|nr:ATP-binding protein [Verrucomicrobiae bacterium]